MLTKIMNRSVEIETLTSGSGRLISTKDLGSCLVDCCRDLVKNSEIEMRTRCENLTMLAQHNKDLLYVKDRQLLNLEHKLIDAKKQMDNIVNTRVFSRGNSLVYELDRTNR